MRFFFLIVGMTPLVLPSGTTAMDDRTPIGKRTDYRRGVYGDYLRKSPSGHLPSDRDEGLKTFSKNLAEDFFRGDPSTHDTRRAGGAFGRFLGSFDGGSSVFVNRGFGSSFNKGVEAIEGSNSYQPETGSFGSSNSFGAGAGSFGASSSFDKGRGSFGATSSFDKGRGSFGAPSSFDKGRGSFGASNSFNKGRGTFGASNLFEHGTGSFGASNPFKRGVGSLGEPNYSNQGTGSFTDSFEDSREFFGSPSGSKDYDVRESDEDEESKFFKGDYLDGRKTGSFSGGGFRRGSFGSDTYEGDKVKDEIYGDRKRDSFANGSHSGSSFRNENQEDDDYEKIDVTDVNSAPRNVYGDKKSTAFSNGGYFQSSSGSSNFNKNNDRFFEDERVPKSSSGSNDGSSFGNFYVGRFGYRAPN